MTSGGPQGRSPRTDVELLSVWRAWDAHPSQHGEVLRLEAALQVAAAELSVPGSVFLATLVAGRRDGLSYEAALERARAVLGKRPRDPSAGGSGGSADPSG